jgi:hypothetical protein
MPEASEPITGMDGLSDSDLWGVMEAGGGSHRPNIVHWDGTSWARSPTDVSDGDLNAVEAISESDAWAVGALSWHGRSLVLHWDGSVWRSVPIPSPEGDYDTLYGVSATGPSDVWAVGMSGFGEGLIIHWDGAAWSVVGHPVKASEFRAVLALSPTDVWAAGGGPVSFSEQSLVEHWDGTSWEVVPLPNPDTNGILSGLAAAGPSDVWAVGEASLRSLIYRWDGATWKRLARAPYGMTGRLRGVAVLAPDDVWVAGLKGLGGPPVTAHWDGSEWTFAPLANKENGWLNTIKAFRHDEVWVGGWGVSTNAIAAQLVDCP